jgi:ribosomal protein L34
MKSNKSKVNIVQFRERKFSKTGKKLLEENRRRYRKIWTVLIRIVQKSTLLNLL